MLNISTRRVNKAVYFYCVLYSQKNMHRASITEDYAVCCSGVASWLPWIVGEMESGVKCCVEGQGANIKRLYNTEEL